MRVRHTAMVLGAVLAGTVVANQAKAIPFPTSPFVTENPNSMLVASFPTESYDPNGGPSGDGLFSVTLGGGFLEDSFTGNPLNDPVFDLNVYINKTNGHIVGGNVNIGGDEGSGDKVYFYATSIDAFGLDDSGDVLKALFTQENAPGGTDTTYAAIGQKVGIVVILPSIAPTVPGSGFTNDLDTTFSPNNEGTEAKATGQPVPEPLSTLLVGIGLSAMGLGATRRRASR
jgi:hypothetical protein